MGAFSIILGTWIRTTSHTIPRGILGRTCRAPFKVAVKLAVLPLRVAVIFAVSYGFPGTLFLLPLVYLYSDLGTLLWLLSFLSSQFELPVLV